MKKEALIFNIGVGHVLEFDSIKTRLVDECQHRKIMLKMQGDNNDIA